MHRYKEKGESLQELILGLVNEFRLSQNSEPKNI